ncbi:hypothetical protein [Saccharibacillus sp. JS10]|uniref:hypothetical protein n=1 Tax=Saccharibacillus sp. JS10 TaxID=2950552 RepID=UPI00210ECE58|nr:hypothetical protein [Saccharibacillus sp. JS10]MCQ4087365.1 hypothetical protein [Saccharibacillus sp. JS10]
MNFLQRIKDGAGRASERAQSAVEIGKLNSHISDIQREIEVHYARMGQIFYENYSQGHTASGEEEIIELCTVCDLLTAEIAELRLRIAHLRNEQLCECGARLDENAVSCPHCGRQWGEEAEAPEAKAEQPQPQSTNNPVELRKESDMQPTVEVEAVHDLVDDPEFLAEEERIQEKAEAYSPEPEESDVREYEPKRAVKPSSVEAPVYAEDEQFETKRFDLGAESSADPDKQGALASSDVYAEAEETAEQREERQRRELREIRQEERRKMNEAKRILERPIQPESSSEITLEEEPVTPVVDPEHERRQRERIEREKERQDELDRLIASWGRDVDRTEDDDIVIRRPVGEVVRCQVCGSGLPKGSKWCPHCASEQI